MILIYSFHIYNTSESLFLIWYIILKTFTYYNFIVYNTLKTHAILLKYYK